MLFESFSVTGTSTVFRSLREGSMLSCSKRVVWNSEVVSEGSCTLRYTVIMHCCWTRSPPRSVLLVSAWQSLQTIWGSEFRLLAVVIWTSFHSVLQQWLAHSAPVYHLSIISFSISLLKHLYAWYHSCLNL